SRTPLYARSFGRSYDSHAWQPEAARRERAARDLRERTGDLVDRIHRDISRARVRDVEEVAARVHAGRRREKAGGERAAGHESQRARVCFDRVRIDAGGTLIRNIDEPAARLSGNTHRGKSGGEIGAARDLRERTVGGVDREP